jgi:tRNA A-37 threonylcarbamoyl transferase component Bud32
MVGTRIGRWLITQQLGQGAFATVYRAEDDLGTQGAIKLYRSQQGELAQRAMSEARALAKISHPNVAEVLDVGAAVDGGWYLVTRFVASHTLARELATHGPMPPRRAVAIARGVARGLQAIHERGLLHRDVKPSNVLLPEGEPEDAAVLIDLGLAGVMEKETGTTASGQFFGTPAYMAPEQVAAQPQDARTDVWGVGVLLHQMLYGSRPFERDTIVQTITAVVTAPLALPPGDSVLNAILTRVLGKQPQERPSMAEVVAALEAWSELPRATGAVAVAPPAFAPVAQPVATGPGPWPFLARLGAVAVLVTVLIAALRLVPYVRSFSWLLPLLAAVVAGGATLLLLRRRAGAPQVRHSLEKAKRKVGGRELVTESLAIAVDDLLERSKENPRLQLLGASMAFEVGQYMESKESADRGKNLENVLRLFQQIEERLAKAQERPSWLERYEKLVVTATASVALVASVVALRKDLFASDRSPKLMVEGCPTAPVGEHQRLMLSPRWDPAPAEHPEKYAWSVDGEPQANAPDGVLWWTPGDGAPRTYAIDVVAAGYGRATCVVQVR